MIDDNSQVHAKSHFKGAKLEAEFRVQRVCQNSLLAITPHYLLSHIEISMVEKHEEVIRVQPISVESFSRCIPWT